MVRPQEDVRLLSLGVPRLGFVPVAVLGTNPSGAGMGDKLHEVASGLAFGRTHSVRLRAVVGQRPPALPDPPSSARHRHDVDAVSPSHDAFGSWVSPASASALVDGVWIAAGDAVGACGAIGATGSSSGAADTRRRLAYSTLLASSQWAIAS